MQLTKSPKQISDATDKECIDMLMDIFKNKPVLWTIAFEINERVRDKSNNEITHWIFIANMIVIYALIFFKWW